MYSNILIPTDGSELAGNAVQHGVALAERIGAKVNAQTVLPPFHTLTTDPQMIEDTPAQYSARKQKHAEKLLVPSLKQRKQQALHAKQFRSTMSFPIGRSSISRRPKAAV